MPPGETPPAETSAGSGAGPREDLTRGWTKGPLFIIGIVALLCAAFFLAFALAMLL